jgi:hypothetical protein
LRLIAPTALTLLLLGLGGCARFEHMVNPNMVQNDRGLTEQQADAGPDRPAHAKHQPKEAHFGPQVAVFDGHELWVDYVCKDDSRLMVRYLGHWADAVTPDGEFHRLTRHGDDILYQGEGGYDLRGDGLRMRWTTPKGAVKCNGRV